MVGKQKFKFPQFHAGSSQQSRRAFKSETPLPHFIFSFSFFLGEARKKRAAEEVAAATPAATVPLAYAGYPYAAGLPYAHAGLGYAHAGLPYAHAGYAYPHVSK